jgi:hypothetical protein
MRFFFYKFSPSSEVHRTHKKNLGYPRFSILYIKRKVLFLARLPIPLGRSDNQPLLDGLSTHTDITNLTIHQRTNTLQIGVKATLGDSSHMLANTTFFLRFTTAPYNAPFDGALSC